MDLRLGSNESHSFEKHAKLLREAKGMPHWKDTLCSEGSTSSSKLTCRGGIPMYWGRHGVGWGQWPGKSHPRKQGRPSGRQCFLMLDVGEEVASPHRGDDGQKLLEQLLCYCTQKRWGKRLDVADSLSSESESSNASLPLLLQTQMDLLGSNDSPSHPISGLIRT